MPRCIKADTIICFTYFIILLSQMKYQITIVVGRCGSPLSPFFASNSKNIFANSDYILREKFFNIMYANIMDLVTIAPTIVVQK